MLVILTIQCNFNLYGTFNSGHCHKAALKEYKYSKLSLMSKAELEVLQKNSLGRYEEETLTLTQKGTDPHLDDNGESVYK